MGGTGGHQEGVGPAGVVIVVHGRRHVQRNQLQGRDKARQAAVALLRGGVRLGQQVAHVIVGDAAVRVWVQRGPMETRHHITGHHHKHRVSQQTRTASSMAKICGAVM